MGAGKAVKVSDAGALEGFLDKKVIVGRENLYGVLSVSSGYPGNEFSVRIGFVRETGAHHDADFFTNPLAEAAIGRAVEVMDFCLADRLRESADLRQDRFDVWCSANLCLQRFDDLLVFAIKGFDNRFSQASNVGDEGLTVGSDVAIFVDTECCRGARSDQKTNPLSALRKYLT